MNQVLSYLPLLELALLHAGFACAQFLVLKAGVFSVAVAGFAAIGAYGSAILATRHGVPTALALILASALAGLVSVLLAVPLARLRGVYQAIATLAFVQVVLSLNLFAEGLTGGAMGLNNIPKSAGILHIGLALATTMAILVVLGWHRVGRAFEAIRQDEAMAASLGISIARYQSVAFLLSGLIAGYFGGLQAFHGYALDPNQFGFPFIVAVLSFVVLGGRRHVLGPLVGTAVLTALPEFARPLNDNRMLIYGVLLMLAMSYMPRGIVDTVLAWLHGRRLRGQRQSLAAGSEAGGAR